MVHMSMATVQHTVVLVALCSNPCGGLALGMAQSAGGTKSVGDAMWLEMMELLPKPGDVLQAKCVSLPPMSPQVQLVPVDVECGDWQYIGCVVVEGRNRIC